VQGAGNRLKGSGVADKRKPAKDTLELRFSNSATDNHGAWVGAD
jgi:hypothetical protein